MTVKELIEILETFPEDLPVKHCDKEVQDVHFEDKERTVGSGEVVIE